MAILSKMKSTLGKLSSAAAPMASKLSVAGKPALLVAKTAAMSNPYTAGALIGGTLLVGGLSLNKKNTLGSIQNKVVLKRERLKYFLGQVQYIWLINTSRKITASWEPKI